ncbi:MAG: metal ABC transporter substrate-binding protein [Verrucomicrobiales bacterium]
MKLFDPQPWTGPRGRRVFLRSAVLAALAPAACGSRSGSGKAGGFKAATTFTILADMARNVAGSAATVQSVTKPGAEIHDYEPTPMDVAGARGAGLIIWNGLGLERWFEKFFSQLDGVSAVVASGGIEPIGISEGPYSGKPNPHAWMSPVNALLYVENIRRALSAAVPGETKTFAINADAYGERLRALDVELRSRLSSIPKEQRVLVTSEAAFSYLARDYGMEELCLWPINADQEGTPQQVRRVIDTVRARNIPVVFSESTVSDRAMRQVVEETGARYGGVLHVDSLTGPEGPAPTYLDLLSYNTDVLLKGFNP